MRCACRRTGLRRTVSSSAAWKAWPDRCRCAGASCPGRDTARTCGSSGAQVGPSRPAEGGGVGGARGEPALRADTIEGRFVAAEGQVADLVLVAAHEEPIVLPPRTDVAARLAATE